MVALNVKIITLFQRYCFYFNKTNQAKRKCFDFAVLRSTKSGAFLSRCLHAVAYGSFGRHDGNP